MDESILNSIKKLLGIESDCNDFDLDVMMGINATFPSLTQIGLGDDTGFSISDATTTWSDYLKDDKMLNNVKMYVYIKTRLVFDTPTSSIAVEMLKEAAKEYEFRIQVYVDKGFLSDETQGGAAVDGD